MSERSHRPRPIPTPESQPFWDGAARGELMLQRCGACGHDFYYARIACPECGSRDVRWFAASGRATVYSFTVARRATHPAFAAHVPYVIAIIELEEGPRMTSNVLCDPARVAVGMPVRVVFEDLGGGMKLPVFAPAAG